MHLEDLRETLVHGLKVQENVTEVKRQLGTALTWLSSTEDLSRALEIVAQSNPGFIVNAEEADLDIDVLVYVNALGLLLRLHVQGEISFFQERLKTLAQLLIVQDGHNVWSSMKAKLPPQ